ncbi:hypothetical protein PIB30_048483 [Stylosanthes scabra]|uniref:Uncharacterized protein n=1 Tax=Stylosanthes scabra TaxID=79078 RepID=A0ABU6RHM7_9FABA|nr:hypothetical protein [Stylosanthes scabra]
MGSCPFPPKFGPYTNSVHIHDTARFLGNQVQTHNESECSSQRNEEEVLVVHEGDLSKETRCNPLTKAIRTKGICEIGGLYFKNDDNDEVLATIGGTRNVGAETQGAKLMKSKNDEEGNLSGSSDEDVPLRVLSAKLKNSDDNVPLASLVGSKNLMKGGEQAHSKKKKVKKGRRWLMLESRILEKRV